MTKKQLIAMRDYCNTKSGDDCCTPACKYGMITCHVPCLWDDEDIEEMAEKSPSNAEEDVQQ